MHYEKNYEEEATKINVPKLLLGDCLPQLKELKDNSVDLIVTDPPYEIGNTKAGGNTKLAKSMQKMNDEIDKLDIVSGFDLKVLDELVRINKNINMYFFQFLTIQGRKTWIRKSGCVRIVNKILNQWPMGL